MKRSKPLRRTPMRQRRVRAEGPTAAPEVKPWAAALAGASLKPLRAASYTGGTAATAPKTTAYRDQALLDMARDRPCLLLVPSICNHRIDTTVAAHSNLSIHGKAGARKADDCYSVWSCAACHGWLDQGGADAFLKTHAFTEAHVLQVLAWRQVAADTGEPERFRRAARRALERLSHPS
jgi:hypothetical protein